MHGCYCGDYDLPSFYTTLMRKARKRHTCYECRNSIGVGEVYELASGSWDGYPPNSYKTCSRCLSLRIWVERNIPCVCWAHGELFSIATEAIDEATWRAPDETRGLRFEFLRKLHSVLFHGRAKYRYLRNSITS